MTAEPIAAETPPSRKKQTRPRGYIAAYHPRAKTLALLDDAWRVMEEFKAHWPLTARQVYYRLVATKAAYPKTEKFYHTLCHHLANARRGRLIPFAAIRDDGTTTLRLGHFDDEEDFLRYVRERGENYTRNKLAGQYRHIEVWCEAGGMLPQLAGVAEPYSIQVYSSGGFDSLTAKKMLADRICSIGKPAIVLHLGDFDPSGVGIFDCVAEDVRAFVLADRPWATVDVEFQRVALTRTQVRRYGLPTAAAKASDSRSKRWSGGTCQLEALPPDVIAAILQDTIEANTDRDLIEIDRAQEAIDRRRIALALPAPPTNDAQGAS